MLTAECARKLMKRFRDQNLNYQRKHTLNRIKNAARNGENRLVLDDPCIHLFEDDYKFFEDLGYSVERGKRASTNPEYTLYYYSVISW
jgi:hypothetical protein